MKTSRLFSLLPCAASLFCLSLPAHAGHWDTVLSNSSNSYTYLNPAYGEDIVSIIVCPASGDVPNNAKTVATADFYWIPDSPTDTPPSSVQVKETPYADYFALSVNQVDDIDVQGTVDDGIGDSTQTFLDTHYGEDDDNWDVYKDVSASSSHLIKTSVDQSSGTVPSCSDQYSGHATTSCSMTVNSDIADVTPYGAGSVLCTFMGFTVQVEAPNTMDIVPLRVDATTAHSSRVFFRVDPAGAVAQTATFTVPGLNGSTTTQTLSNVSGEFSCDFDEGQLPSGSSSFVLQWSAGDGYAPIDGTTISVGAARTSAQATNSTGVLAPCTVGDNEPTGTGGPDATIVVVPITHCLYEDYEKFSYSLPVVPESQTIHVENSDVNISTIDSSVIPSVISGWSESHYYQDDNGRHGAANMTTNPGAVTLPAQSQYFQSAGVASDLFFAPNHNLIGVGSLDIIFFELDDSPSLYAPYFLVHPEVSVPIN